MNARSMFLRNWVVLMALAVCTSFSIKAGVAVSIFPPRLVVQHDGIFTTETRLTSWDNAVGAYSIRVEYDTNLMRLLEITVPSASALSSNTFWNSNSFSSGQTRVVAFQTADASSYTNGEVAFTMRWQATGPAGYTSGITNVVEDMIDERWRPVDVLSHPAAIMIDTDGNGISDDWELKYFGHIGLDADADPDGDGFTNLQEYLAGTDPTRKDNALSIGTIQRIGPNVLILFQTSLGKNYQFEYSDSVDGRTWVPVANQVVGTGKVEQIVDVGSGTQLTRFYRVRLVP